MEFGDMRAQYLAAQLRGDRREAVRLALEAGATSSKPGWTALEQQLRLIQEAQWEIGRLWQENTISVAQEHMATAIANIALARVYESAAREPQNAKKIAVACVEGEQHDFPARMVADALDLAGFSVFYLGADVPTSSLVEFVKREAPDLLALSVTMDFNLPALRSALAQVREADRSLSLAVGGNACMSEGLAHELGADGGGRNASEVVITARKLLGLT
jgi:methanogenic corrinoid protein MtbC1